MLTQYVQAYVRRNKTDAADAAALFEVIRCCEIRPVPVKSVDQQATVALASVIYAGLDRSATGPP